MLSLYDYYRSSACFRVRIALNLKQLDYTAIPIHLINNGGEQHSSTYTQLNAQALVPTLQENNFTLTQSVAIIEYLNDAYPTPPLLPHDIKLKALVRAFALIIAADTHPLNNLRVLNYLKHEFHLTDTQKNTWYQHWMHLSLAALEAQLEKYNEQSNFCFGNEPTLADICLIPHLFNAERFHCQLNSYPTIMRIYAHCKTHPAFSQAFPLEVAV